MSSFESVRIETNASVKCGSQRRQMMMKEPLCQFPRCTFSWIPAVWSWWSPTSSNAWHWVPRWHLAIFQSRVHFGRQSRSYRFWERPFPAGGMRQLPRARGGGIRRPRSGICDLRRVSGSGTSKCTATYWKPERDAVAQNWKQGCDLACGSLRPILHVIEDGEMSRLCTHFVAVFHLIRSAARSKSSQISTCMPRVHVS